VHLCRNFWLSPDKGSQSTSEFLPRCLKTMKHSHIIWLTAIFPPISLSRTQNFAHSVLQPSGQLFLPAWQPPPASCACTPAMDFGQTNSPAIELQHMLATSLNPAHSALLNFEHDSASSGRGAYSWPGDGIRHEEDSPHDMHQRFNAATVNVLVRVGLQTRRALSEIQRNDRLDLVLLFWAPPPNSLT